MNENKEGYWEHVYGVSTPGGSPVWKCPFCGKDEHVMGIEVRRYRHNVCKNCGAKLEYD